MFLLLYLIKIKNFLIKKIKWNSKSTFSKLQIKQKLSTAPLHFCTRLYVVWTNLQNAFHRLYLVAVGRWVESSRIDCLRVAHPVKLLRKFFNFPEKNSVAKSGHEIGLSFRFSLRFRLELLGQLKNKFNNLLVLLQIIWEEI